MAPDVADDLDLAERLVRTASGIALASRGGAVERKGLATDVVTEADRRAEAALVDVLAAARAEPAPLVHVRCCGPLKRPAADVRAATLGAAAAAVDVTLGAHVVAAVNGDRVAPDPDEPLAERDEVALTAADAAG